MFPAYSDRDFGDFKPNTLEQRTQPTEHKTGPELDITPEDVSLVYKWHSDFVRNLTRAEWLPAPKKLVGSDVVTPLLQRYSIFGRVVKVWEAFDAEMERELTPSLMTFVALIKEKVDGSGKYDITNVINSLLNYLIKSKGILIFITLLRRNTLTCEKIIVFN